MSADPHARSDSDIALPAPPSPPTNHAAPGNPKPDGRFARVFWGLLIGGLLAFAFAPHQDPARSSEGVLVQQILQKIESSYVDAKDSDDLKSLFHDGLDHMVRQLDRNTRYIAPKDVQQFEGDTEGTYIGIGVVLSPPRDDYAKITTVINGGPADEAGLKEGDVLRQVNGEELQGLPLEEVTKRIKGVPGSEVELTVARAEELVTLRVRRARVEMASVAGVRLYLQEDLDEHAVGYVRLIQFQDGTTEEIFGAVRNLVRAGADSLVLDLRYNGGGVLDEAIQVSQLFLREGVILRTRGRSDRDRPRVYTVEAAGPFADLPIAVLVDQGSASASEIVAACLRDHHRALLIGSDTYGKWTVQTIFPLGENSVDGILKLTTRRHFPPEGLGIRKSEDGQRLGLEPDLPVAMDDETFIELYRRWQREAIARVNTPLRVDEVTAPTAENLETFPTLHESGSETAKLVIDEPVLRAIETLSNPDKYWELIAGQNRWTRDDDSDGVNRMVAKEPVRNDPNLEPKTPRGKQ